MIAVVLAAGRGERMGGPKALLPWDDGTLLVAQLRAALRVGCDRAVGVVREGVAVTLEGRVPAGALLLVSREEDALGPAGSLAAFARRAGAIPPDEVVALAPVDVLPAAWRALEPLARGLLAEPMAVAARPVLQGRRGHPVLVRDLVLAQYRAPLPPRPLREVLASFGDRVTDVAVDEPGVLADLDTPEDVARVREG